MTTRRTRFEAAFREVYEPLQVYARRRTDAATADDVVADALLVLWRRLDDVPDGMVVPWSYGIARRCLANHRRADVRREALADRLSGVRMVDEGADHHADGDDELHAAMDELSADDRELLRLWAWEGLQPRDIAVVLDISANAAAIRMHRAKQRLGEALQRKSRGDAGQVVVGHTADNERNTL